MVTAPNTLPVWSSSWRKSLGNIVARKQRKRYPPRFTFTCKNSCSQASPSCRPFCVTLYSLVRLVVILNIRLGPCQLASSNISHVPWLILIMPDSDRFLTVWVKYMLGTLSICVQTVFDNFSMAIGQGLSNEKYIHIFWQQASSGRSIRKGDH